MLRAPRRYPVAALLALLVVAVLAATTACGNHQSELQTSLTVLNAARDGFTAWDDQHQGEIVRAATTLEEGKSELDTYRKKREPVIRGFELAYKTLATAALTPDTANLLQLAVSLADLKTAVTDLGAAWPKDKTP